MTDYKNFENILDSRLSEAVRASDFVKKILVRICLKFVRCVICSMTNNGRISWKQSITF